MHLLYLHQYFNSPSEPGSTRSYWICKELIKQGHRVTVVTSKKSSNSNSNIQMDGINIIYLNVSYNQSMSFFRRIISFLSFTVKSSLVSLKLSNIDIVLATSTPLTIGIPALILKKVKKIPYIFEVRDLWPEVPIQMGIMKNTLLIIISKYLEKLIYKNSIHVVSLSPGMEEGVLKYIEPFNSSMIPNMAKIDQFYPRSINESLLKEYSINKDAFKIIYFGAMGESNGLFDFFECIKAFNNDNNFQFIFLGEGSKKKELIDICKNENLRNVIFINSMPMNITSDLVNLCDIVVVSFLNIPILYTNSPNKLFDALSAGKPILVNSNGWTRKLVEEGKCGFYFDPLDPNDFKSIINKLSKNKDLLNLMSINSRILAERIYDKNILCAKYVNLIESLYKNI